MNSEFYNEVKKQPQSIKNTVDKYRANNFELLDSAKKILLSSQAVVMSGMGTSYNVCLSALAALGKKLRVNAVQSYQLINTAYSGVKDGDTLILISQSGESGEILRVCSELKGKNEIIAITNNENSTLAKSAKIVLPLYCEEEKSITNSTFTATLCVLSMLCASVNGEDINICAEKLIEGSIAADDFINNESSVFEIADILGTHDRVHFIGRNGEEMALAEQASLTFKEGANINAHCFNIGSFRHGPMELCGTDHFAFLYISDEETLSVVKDFKEKMIKNGSTVIPISRFKCDYPSIYINVNSTEAYLMASAVINEMLLIKAAANRGKEAGIFKIAGKICREV